MKKKLLYFIAIAFVLAACTTKDIPHEESIGLLKINPISINTEVEVSPLTRAVDDRLQIDIYSASTIIKSFQPGDPGLDELIKLPVGDNYRLVAHTPDMKEAENNALGYPIYSVSHDFVIEKEQTTTISSLVAKQSNIGISVSLNDEVFDTAFQTIECTIFSSSGRSVVIDAKLHSQEKAYFNVSEGTAIGYKIKFINNDDEAFESDVKQLPLDDKIKDYIITVSF